MKSFKTSNFRLFNKKGVEVFFRPITIFTGANSSGKSSFVKSVVLLKNYLEAFHNSTDKNPASIQLDFTDPVLKLAGFNDVINEKCGEQKAISFSVSTTSALAPCEGFVVEYSFKASPYSDTKAELESIMLYYDGNLVLEIKADNGHLRSISFDYKGVLLETFLNYAKYVVYNHSVKRYENNDTSTAPLSAITKDGIDVKEWKTFFDYYSSVPELGKEKRHLDKYNEIDIATAIQKVEETGVLLFFPVFDSLKGDSKEKTISDLKQLPIDWTLKDRVIADFRSAKEESFVDYYKRLEDEEMKDYRIVHNADSSLRYGVIEDLIWEGGVFFEYSESGFNVSSASIFHCVLQLMHCWQNLISKGSDAFVERYKRNPSEFYYSASHTIVDFFTRFLLAFIPDVLFPHSLEMVEFVGSSFTPIQRLYSFEDNSSFVSTIKKYMRLKRTIGQNAMSEPKKLAIKKRKEAFLNGTLSTIETLLLLSETDLVEYKPGSFINKWLKELGIASRFIIKEDTDGLGFKVFLEKKAGKRRVNLADEGHGITQLFSILLHIECAIMQKAIDVASGLNEEIESWNDFAGNVRVLAIEEPEVSLHPSMQSILAQMFEDANRQYGVNFIIETHSEYLVRKTQVYVSQLKDKKKNPFAIYYFTKGGDAYELGYTDSGSFINQFGTGFLDEAAKLHMAILYKGK